ncbi:MAG: hypothetical protein ACO3DD_09965, partial [Burkholderiaceae bacterium]
DSTTGELYLDFNLGIDYSDTLALELNLTELAGYAGISLPPGFTDLLDASGQASIGLQLGADLSMRLGAQLPTVKGQALKVSIADYNAQTQKGTRLALSAGIVATDLNLKTRIAALDMGIENGAIVLDADGLATTQAPALLEIKMVNGRPVFDLTGALDIRLPLTASVFKSELPIGVLDVQTRSDLGGQGLKALVEQIAGTAPANARNALEIKLPDFDLAAAGKSSLIQLLYDPSAVIDGVDLGLGAVQDLFQSSIAADLPLIGNKLADAGSVIGNLRSGLLQDLRTALAGPGKPVELMRDTLFEVFSDLGILLDANDDGVVTESDISVGFYSLDGKLVYVWNENMPLPTSGLDSLRFDMDLGGRILGTGIDIPLEFDLPGFALDIDGGFELAADWHYDFGFGLSAANGFFLGTNTGDEEEVAEIRLDLEAYLDGSPTDPKAFSKFRGRGQLLFFEADVVDTYVNRLTGKEGSGIRGSLALDLAGNDAGQLTLSRVLAAPAKAIEAKFDVNADVRLELG